jgi:hypothetical protein
MASADFSVTLAPEISSGQQHGGFLRAVGLYLQRFVRLLGFAVACQLARASGLTARSCSYGRRIAFGPFAPPPHGENLAYGYGWRRRPRPGLSPG